MEINLIKSIYFIVLLVLPSKCIYIQKCCNKNELLTLNYTSCIVDNEIRRTKFFLFNKSSELIINNKMKIEFLYNQDSPCSESDRVVLSHKDIHILNNGSLSILNKNIQNNSLIILSSKINNEPYTMTIPYNLYCVNRIKSTIFESKDQLIQQFIARICPCHILPCIRKCCPDKHYLNDDICQYSSDISPEWKLKYTDFLGKSTRKEYKFAFIQDIPRCKHGHRYLNENSFGTPFSVLPSGDINIENGTTIHAKDYCLYKTNINKTFNADVNLRICDPNFKSNFIFENIWQGIYFVVGSFFLALTLVVHILDPELRSTLHSYYLMCHVACLLVCYTTLASAQIFYMWLSKWVCIIAAHAVPFSFVAAIFWLNVWCIDISITFSDYGRIHNVESSQSNKKTFLMCSLYVFGATSIISFLIVLSDFVNNLYNFNSGPIYEIQTCWHFDTNSLLLYFYLPISTVILVNFILFVFTTTKIVKMLKDSRKMFNRGSTRHTGKVNRSTESDCLISCIKLFMLMGVTGIFEIILLAFCELDSFWYFADATNSLRGVTIFIYVCVLREKNIVWLVDWLSNLKRDHCSISSRSNTKCSVQTMMSDFGGIIN